MLVTNIYYIQNCYNAYVDLHAYRLTIIIPYVLHWIVYKMPSFK